MRRSGCRSCGTMVYLRLAQEQFQKARAIVKNGGDAKQAEMLLRRAEADAELAVALAKEENTYKEAQRLHDELQALHRKAL